MINCCLVKWQRLLVEMSGTSVECVPVSNQLFGLVNYGQTIKNSFVKPKVYQHFSVFRWCCQPVLKTWNVYVWAWGLSKAWLCGLSGRQCWFVEQKPARGKSDIVMQSRPRHECCVGSFLELSCVKCWVHMVHNNTVSHCALTLLLLSQ